MSHLGWNQKPVSGFVEDDEFEDSVADALEEEDGAEVEDEEEEVVGVFVWIKSCGVPGFKSFNKTIPEIAACRITNQQQTNHNSTKKKVN